MKFTCVLKAIVLLVFSAGSICFADAPSTAPSTRPTLTPEQRAIVETFNKQDITQPACKIDIAAYNHDGTPNPGFGKPDPVFLKMHESFLQRKAQPIGLLFIGDSITAGWVKAKTVWNDYYGKYDPANFGIGGDRTQNVLWRIQQGELDGISPKVVVLMIGTNNSAASPEKMIAGVKAVVDQIHAKLPHSKLLLLGIFPRGPSALDKDGKPDAGRAKLQAVNAELAKLDDGHHTRYLEIWKPFLTDDCSITKEIMPDFLHPSEKGYAIWAEAMQPLLDEMIHP